MKKAVPYILLLLLAATALLIYKFKDDKSPSPETTTTTTKRKDPAGNLDRDRGFDRRVSNLEYSNHAKCRMQCRHITQSEVEEIMQDGLINYNKSDLQNARCPRYAVEGVTHDNQQVRIVFAQCNDKTEVVTVIDLGEEWPCHCPGDEKK
jgi:hypothetical protein